MKVKRLLALLMTLAMIFSLALPVTVFAEDEEDVVVAEEELTEETVEEPVEETVVEEPVAEEAEPEAEPVEENAEEPVEEIAEEPVEEALEEEADSWEDGTGNVAQIGDIEYPTLQEAIDAASDGQTITLLADITIGPDAASTGFTADFTITKNLTIDGNNKTINVTGSGSGNVFQFYEGNVNPVAVDCTLKNLTINSTGKQVDILVGGVNACENKLNVSGVTVTSQGECLYASDGAIITSSGNSFTKNGDYAAGKDKVYYSAMVVGYAGVINSTNDTIKSDKYAVATFPSGGTITLINTDVEGTVAALYSRTGNGGISAEPDNSSIVVRSGKVKGGYLVEGTSTNGHTATITITGGLFSADPSAHVANGYKVVSNPDATTSSAYPHMVVSDSAVAVIGSSQYTTLEAAISAAQEGDTITLLANVTVADSIEIAKSITVDFQQFTLDCSKYADLFHVTSGNVVITGTTGGIRGTGSQIWVSGGTLTVEGGVYQNANSEKTDAIFYIPGGSVTITGGTFNAVNNSAYNTLFYVDGGSLSVQGGEYLNKVPAASYIAEGYFCLPADSEGYVAVVSQTVSLDKSYLDVGIGGTDTVAATLNEKGSVTWSSEDESIATVSGGVVTGAAEGTTRIIATAPNGSTAECVVTVGSDNVTNITKNKNYISLAAAVEDANTGDELKLLKNQTLMGVVTFPAGKTLTLDLNGKTLTENAAGARLMDNYGTLTITNGTINQVNADSYGVIRNSGNLTLTSSVTMIDDGGASGSTVNNSESGAVLVVEGGTYSATNDNGACNGVFNVNSGTTATISNATVNSNNATGYGVYPITNRGGTLTVTNVTVNSKRGALANNAGTTTVNGGDYSTDTANGYYAFWITNDGDDTTVTINGTPKFNGYTYGVYAAIDDGKQDVSDVKVTINGGYFNSVVKGNTSSSSHTWEVQIMGGYFKTAPAATLVADGYDVISLSDSSTGDDATAFANGYRYKIQGHEHSYDTFVGSYWRNINGSFAAVFTYKCSCGATEIYTVEPTYSDSTGTRTYTASYTGSDAKTHNATMTKEVNYFVTFGNQELGPYTWGQICTLTADSVKAWYIGETKVADGTLSYTFPVTGTVTVTTVETTETVQQAVVSATLTSTESGKATFNAKWSLPEGATVTSATVYRGTTTSSSTVEEELLTSKGKAHNTGLLVRNGDYTLKLSGLSAGKYQHAVIVIEYTVGGSTDVQTLTSGVKSVVTAGGN